MGAPSLAEVALGAGSWIGRYFGLVSAIPSALVVTFIYALIKSGAWTGPPDWGKAADALQSLSLGELSLLLLMSLALALLMHPLQFALTQVLEGYWGTTYVARSLAAARIRHHRVRRTKLEELRNQRLGALATVREVLRFEAGIEYVPAVVDVQEFDRALMTYPERADRILPTRLGNALRRHEDRAGAQYGLNAMTVYPHLLITGKPGQTTILIDNREQLDLAVRLCALSLVASAIAFVYLVTDGLWVLLALALYLLAYGFYRGAIVAAQNYGAALTAIIDLNRFELYEALHVTLPANTMTERQRNSELMALLESRRFARVSFVHRREKPG